MQKIESRLYMKSLSMTEGIIKEIGELELDA